MKKVCTKCNTLKSTKLFSKSKKVKGGYRHWCKLCVNLWTKQWRKLHAKRLNEKARKDRIDNPNKYKKYNSNRRKKWKETKLRRYGITIQILNKYLKLQKNKCKCCNILLKNNYKIDHDHLCCPKVGSCGKCIRGILCNNCNLSLGLNKENIKILQGQIKYLVTWKEKNESVFSRSL